MSGRPRNEAQTLAQRERILSAAEALLVSHGVERSRLRDVAEAAGFAPRPPFVDFCMTMAALSELKAHGRVLTPDERFGLQILRSMQHRQ